MNRFILSFLLFISFTAIYADNNYCVRIYATDGWVQIGLPGSYTHISSIRGSWTVDYRAYKHVGPGGHEGNDSARLAPYNSYKYDQKYPFGQLLMDMPNKGVVPVSQALKLPYPINYTAFRINDSDRSLGDNDGNLEICFSNGSNTVPNQEDILLRKSYREKSGLSLTGYPKSEICINKNRSPYRFGDDLGCTFAASFSPIYVPFIGLTGGVDPMNEATLANIYYQTEKVKTTHSTEYPDAAFSDADRIRIYNALIKIFKVIRNSRSSLLTCMFDKNTHTKNTSEKLYYISKEEFNGHLENLVNNFQTVLVLGGFNRSKSSDGTWNTGMAYNYGKLIQSKDIELYHLNLNITAIRSVKEYTDEVWASTIFHELIHNTGVTDGTSYEHTLSAADAKFLVNKGTKCMKDLAKKY